MQVKRKIFGLRIWKTAIGAAVAVLISQLLHLDYAANSGIIVILSVQSSKKKSLDLAIMRIASTLLALSIGTMVFSIVGFNALAFGIYLLLFIPAAVKLNLNDGIVPCSVLVTHLLSIKSVSAGALLNEMLQMLIGAGIGFILNLYMPSLEKRLDQYMRAIDSKFVEVLTLMSQSIKCGQSHLPETHFNVLAEQIKTGYEEALREHENRWMRGQNIYVQYMSSRRVQYEILFHMRRYFKRLSEPCEQTHMVAELTALIAQNFEGVTSKKHLFEAIAGYRSKFRSMPLPETRAAFENRAALYEYVNDLEHLLELNVPEEIK